MGVARNWAKLQVEECCFHALNSLAQRAEPMNMEDAQHMGIDDVLKIAAVRERYSTAYSTSVLREVARSKVRLDFTPAIREIFQL